MRIVDRYFNKEVLNTWLAVLIVLLLVLVGRNLVQILKESVPGDLLAPLLALSTIKYLVWIIPFSFFLGILLTLGRLYSENEMAALNTGGVGISRLYRSLSYLLVPTVILSGWMSLFVVPWSNIKIEELFAEASNRSVLLGLEAGRFTRPDDSGSIFFTETLENDEMQQVLLMQKKITGDGVEKAKQGRIVVDAQERRFLVFNEGYRYQEEGDALKYRVIQFEEHGVRVDDPNMAFARSNKLNTLSNSELWAINTPKSLAELHWRLAIPLSTLLLALIAIPLSYTQPRKGRYSKIGYAILVFILYSNLLSVGVKMLEKEQLPSILGLWWVHGVFLVIFYVLFMWRTKLRWLNPRKAIK